MTKFFCFLSFWMLFSITSFGFTIGSTEFNRVLHREISIFNIQKQDISLTDSKDTLALIEGHLKKADENKNKGAYALSYEHLWEAMLLAEAINNKAKLVSIHDELGVLYGIYGKEEKAIEHKHRSLLYVKQDTLSAKRKARNLGRAYFNLAVQYRKAKKLDRSLVYLDSCVYTEKNMLGKQAINPYVSAERGYVYLLKNKLDKAERYLLESKQIFEEDNKHYLVVVYSFLGDLYVNKKDSESAIYFYEKSLNSMFIFKSHTDLKSDIFKKIATLLNEKGALKKAYFYLEESTKISDSLFSMRSKNNRALFEIKNRHEEALLKKNAYIKEQDNIIERKNLIQSRLVFIIGFILLSLIALLTGFYHKTKLRKLKTEKERATIKVKHEKEKFNAILETKQKELTVSALQLIEKDKNIDTLLGVLKQESPDSYRKVKEEVIKGNNDMWERFNLRFTEVNTDFYNRLREKHKTLTPTEQKHCALIKLKFDSKEMAKILNISLNSVHISRHRIRKKIGLHRDENLSNYIANF